MGKLCGKPVTPFYLKSSSMEKGMWIAEQSSTECIKATLIGASLGFIHTEEKDKGR